MKRTHRRKEITEVQKLKQENKELRTENKRLKSQMKQLERREYFYENVEQDTPNVAEELTKPRCLECGKGELEYHNVVGRVWYDCTVCNWRSKTTLVKQND